MRLVALYKCYVFAFALVMFFHVISASEVTNASNYNLKLHKYVCITSSQPDTKSNPNCNQNPNPTTKQHAIVNIQLNIVSCPTYPDKFMQDSVVAPVSYTHLTLPTKRIV